jgi:hypothetical protein
MYAITYDIFMLMVKRNPRSKELKEQPLKELAAIMSVVLTRQRKMKKRKAIA